MHSRQLRYLQTPQAAIGGRAPPIAVVADKLTALRRTNQMVGFLSIDFTVGAIVASLAGSRVVKDHSGPGVAVNIDEVLRVECKLTPEMLKLQVTGQGYDGAYFHCSVPQAVAANLGHRDEKWTLPGWDIAHQLELVLNKVRDISKWYGEMADKVSRVIAKVKWGKGQEKARETAERMKIVLRDTSAVCETRFASSERKVYKNFLANWEVLEETIRELVKAESDAGDRKILQNLVNLIHDLAWLVQMMGLIDVLRILKDVSLFAQTVNALEWEKVEQQQAAWRRLKETMVPQLDNGKPSEADFPYLASNITQLRAGKWHGKSLKLIAAAQGDSQMAVTFALKNVAAFVNTLCAQWFSRILGPSKLPKQFALMAGCLDLRKLIQTPCPLQAQESSLRQLHEWTMSCHVINELLFQQWSGCLSSIQRCVVGCSKLPQQSHLRQSGRRSLREAGLAQQSCVRCSQLRHFTWVSKTGYSSLCIRH